MIAISCVCGHAGNVPEKFAGQVVRCPKCQERISVAAADNPNAFTVVEPDQPRRQPIDLPDPMDESNASALGVAGGCLSLGVIGTGVLILLFYAMMYDTSVLQYPQIPNGPRVYDRGLEQNRLIGVIVGIGFMVFGAVMMFFCRRPAKS